MIPTKSDIEAAHKRIENYVHRTPTLLANLSANHGPLELKLENTQRTGSFKVRGAFNTLLSTDVPNVGVVAASGGNHGAAVAFSARKLGHPATIFVPELAGAAKIALIKSTGAELHVVPGTYADALHAAQMHEEKTGAMQIHAYDAMPTIAGQGTLAAEWEQQGLQADTVLIAVGGGGLIGGAMAWLEGQRNVVAVEPEACPTLYTARKVGSPSEVDVGGIAANALGARKIGQICFQLAERNDITCVTVSDETIQEAQRTLWSELRQWVEPAGAAALAALLGGAYVPAKDERVAVLVCGANPVPGPFD